MGSNSTHSLQRDAIRLKKALSLNGLAKKAALFAYSRPIPKTSFDRSLVLVDIFLGLWVLANSLIGFLDHGIYLIAGVVFLPVSLFIADFIGQCFHKWLDTYAGENHFLWGKAAQEFRKHHENPNNLNHVGYLDHISAFGRIMFPLFVLAAFVDWKLYPALGLNIGFLLLVLLNATEFHKQAHRKTPSLWAKKLQDWGLIINKKAHMKHHKPPFESDYAVINAWSTPLTCKTNFWKNMDRWFWHYIGKLPRTWIQDPRAIPTDIYNELLLNPQKIPADLLTYSQVYPNRLNHRVRALLEAKARLVS